MHLQPVFAGGAATYPQPLHAREGRSGAEALFRDGRCLPAGTAMGEGDLARVVGVVRGMGRKLRTQTCPPKTQPSAPQVRVRERRQRIMRDQTEGPDVLPSLRAQI
jgi:hypothetical protein